MDSEKRLQCQGVLRAYIDEFGYIASRNGNQPMFVGSCGEVLSIEQIEATKRYIGFAEASFGLLPRMEDAEYTEGYNRAQRRISSRLLTEGANL